MAIIVDGTDGITAPGLASTAGQTIATTLDVTGATTLASLQVNGIATDVYPIVSSTSVASTSGTSINFTSIASYAKRITLLFRNVSTSGLSNYQIQLGSSAGYKTSGYNGVSMRAVATATGTTADTTGFRLQSLLATATSNGLVTFSTYDNLTWYGLGNVADSTNAVIFTFGGAVTLPGVLNSIRVTTVNGTDTFDAGSISIILE
jgi:hypothetical protein